MKNKFIVLMVLVLLGCDDSNENKQSIVGTWENSCHENYIDDIQYGYVFDHFEIASDGTFYQESYVYDSLNCESDNYEIEIWEGTYSVGKTNDELSTNEIATPLRLSYSCSATSDNCTDIFSSIYLVQGQNDKDAGEIISDIWFGTGPDESTYVSDESIFYNIDNGPSEDDSGGCFINSFAF